LGARGEGRKVGKKNPARNRKKIMGGGGGGNSMISYWVPMNDLCKGRWGRTRTKGERKNRARPNATHKGRGDDFGS